MRTGEVSAITKRLFDCGSAMLGKQNARNAMTKAAYFNAVHPYKANFAPHQTPNAPKGQTVPKDTKDGQVQKSKFEICQMANF